MERDGTIFLHFFNLTYFLGLCPFRLVCVPGHNSVTNPIFLHKNLKSLQSSHISCEFRVKSTKFNKICCALNTAFMLFWYLVESRSVHMNRHPLTDPTYYFRTARGFAAFLITITTLNIFWNKADELARIMNQVKKLNSKPIQKTTAKFHYKNRDLVNKIAISINVLLFAIAITSFYLLDIKSGPQRRMGQANLTLGNSTLRGTWSGRIVTKVRFAFGMQLYRTADHPTLENRLILVFGMIGLFYRRWFRLLEGWLLPVVAATLWLETKAFANSLRNNEVRDRSQVLESFKALKKLTSQINSTFGLIIFSFMALNLLQFSVTIQNFIIPQQIRLSTWLQISFFTGFYFGVSSVFYGLAMGICQNVRN